MRKTRILFGLALVGALAGCLENDSQRGLAGAAAGAVIADATDNNVLTGAALGGLAGVFCDDLNVPGCQSRY